MFAVRCTLAVPFVPVLVLSVHRSPLVKDAQLLCIDLHCEQLQSIAHCAFALVCVSSGSCHQCLGSWFILL